jgi:hypothetical protein
VKVGGRFTSVKNLVTLAIAASNDRSMDKLLHVVTVQQRAAERTEQFLWEKYLERGTVAARRAAETARARNNEARGAVVSIKQLAEVPIYEDDVEAVEWEMGVEYDP